MNIKLKILSLLGLLALCFGIRPDYRFEDFGSKYRSRYENKYNSGFKPRFKKSSKTHFKGSVYNAPTKMYVEQEINNYYLN